MMVDEQRYSRQLYVLGKDAQDKLQSCKVLVTGWLNGLAAEIAKNLMLAGVQSLTLADDGTCRVVEMASNMFLRDEDLRNRVGRSQVLMRELADLNRYVALNSRPESELTFDQGGYGMYDVIVVVNGSRKFIEDIDLFCRDYQSKQIKLCCAGTYGLYGYVFNDFGPSFVVNDVDGETPKHGIVIDIRKLTADIDQAQQRLLVLTSDEKHHGLKDGDLVTFSGVKGFVGLNDGLARVVKLETIVNGDGHNVHGYAFSVETDDVVVEGNAYLGGGNYQQVKVPQTVSFRSFEESVSAPSCIDSDWTDMSMPLKLHALLLSLWDFEGKSSERLLPAPGNNTDAEQVVRFASEHYSDSLDESSKTTLKKLALGSSGQLCPMTAFIGGIAAQEVLKASSGKFQPIQQWFHFAAPEALIIEKGSTFPTQEQLAGQSLWSKDARYAGQAAVFGWEFQRKLGSKKGFIVGAGALGCETLKNMAMMGVGCSEEGMVTVTDMDGIEVSNLSRQFLFRQEHVGQMKSVVAASMSKKMNPSFNIKALELKVAPETEGSFDDTFWSSVDTVVNALDNVVARQYVDSKCLFHQKPLLESGTLGTKANTLPVVPHLTESYSSDPVKDDGNDEIPACTLHAYPNLMEHTLAWARDAVFEKYFNLDILEAQNFLLRRAVDQSLAEYQEDLDRQPTTKLVRLRTARAVLCGPEPTDHSEKLFPYSVDFSGGVDLKKCVLLARLRFEELFVNKIIQLLHVHPLNKTVDDKGTKFWSGKRRPPRVEIFNSSNKLHMLFLISATKLFATVYDLHLPSNALELEQSVQTLLAELPEMPDFHVDGSVRVPENDEEAKKFKKEEEEKAKREAASAEEECALEFAKLQSCGSEVQLVPQVFEKDEDSNGHMDIIYSAACIRAHSYDIPLVEPLEAKRIVGRIIPAIATTTASTTGLVGLELYKIVQNCHLSQFRATNINLAVNSFASFEPVPCKSRVFGKRRYIRSKDDSKTLNVTIWTMLDLLGDKTVQEVLDFFSDRFEFDVTSISTKGDVSLYNDMFGQEDRLDQPLSELYRSIIGAEPPTYIVLNVDGDFEDDEEEDESGEEDEEEEEEDDDDEYPIPPCRLRWLL